MKILSKFLMVLICSISFSAFVYGQNFSGNNHVNGGGTASEFGVRSTFVFNAVATEGGVVGHLVYHLRAFNISFKMDLDCMEIRGNRATLSGTVTSITGDDIPFYIFPGSRASFTVEDNGNGRNRDRISDVVFGEQCNWDLDTYIKVQGNISIR